MDQDTAELVSLILNASWMVRHYSRSTAMRSQAILKLGHTLRYALAKSEDFEPLIAAILDGLRPAERRPF